MDEIKGYKYSWLLTTSTGRGTNCPILPYSALFSLLIDLLYCSENNFF